MDVDDEITSKNRVIPVFLPGKGAENTFSLTGLLQHCVPFGYRNCILYTLWDSVSSDLSFLFVLVVFVCVQLFSLVLLMGQRPHLMITTTKISEALEIIFCTFLMIDSTWEVFICAPSLNKIQVVGVLPRNDANSVTSCRPMQWLELALDWPSPCQTCCGTISVFVLQIRLKKYENGFDSITGSRENSRT